MSPRERYDYRPAIALPMGGDIGATLAAFDALPDDSQARLTLALMRRLPPLAQRHIMLELLPPGADE